MVQIRQSHTLMDRKALTERYRAPQGHVERRRPSRGLCRRVGPPLRRARFTLTSAQAEACLLPHRCKQAEPVHLP